MNWLLRLYLRHNVRRKVLRGITGEATFTHWNVPGFEKGRYTRRQLRLNLPPRARYSLDWSDCLSIPLKTFSPTATNTKVRLKISLSFLLLDDMASTLTIE
jgi:hypothetical protein